MSNFYIYLDLFSAVTWKYVVMTFLKRSHKSLAIISEKTFSIMNREYSAARKILQ